MRSVNLHRRSHGLAHSSSSSSSSSSRSSSSRLPFDRHMQSSRIHVVSCTASTDALKLPSRDSSDASTSINGSLVVRRAVLLGPIAGTLLCSSPANASLKLTISRKAQLKPYTLKAGHQVTVPDSWALAYDRSDKADLGTEAFFGNFNTLETLSIFKQQQPENAAVLSPEQLLQAVLAEQRNNQSTFGFDVVNPIPTARVPDAADGSPGSTTYYDAEYELAICRGLSEEGSAGKRRCVGPNDMDLQIVSRHFFQTFVLQGDYMYIVRGSATADMWSEVRPAAVQAVQSFRLAQA
eukprot:GHRQ01024045.1.p1 GENE.GHRQ01024045.1~~GHRQ01024045.1.p1  ORF type:complete len:294 (+),score=82.40 GHRQ01024045.1:281-1162(+)